MLSGISQAQKGKCYVISQGEPKKVSVIEIDRRKYQVCVLGVGGGGMGKKGMIIKGNRFSI